MFHNSSGAAFFVIKFWVSLAHDWRSKTWLAIFFASVRRQFANARKFFRNMLIQRPQAISGVSPDHESVIEELYPSIAETSIADMAG